MKRYVQMNDVGSRPWLGETTRLIAAALSIAPSCVSKWKRRLAETGSLEPGRVGGRKKRTRRASEPTGCVSVADPARSRHGD